MRLPGADLHCVRRPAVVRRRTVKATEGPLATLALPLGGAQRGGRFSNAAGAVFRHGTIAGGGNGAGIPAASYDGSFRVRPYSARVCANLSARDCQSCVARSNFASTL